MTFKSEDVAGTQPKSTSIKLAPRFCSGSFLIGTQRDLEKLGKRYARDYLYNISNPLKNNYQKVIKTLRPSNRDLGSYHPIKIIFGKYFENTNLRISSASGSQLRRPPSAIARSSSNITKLTLSGMS